MDILELLDTSQIISSYEIINHVSTSSRFLIKVKVLLINQTILFIREYIDNHVFDYSYHWQSKNGEVLVRWDNAPHYKKIDTFPHHKHIKNSIQPSYETNLSDILTYIENKIHKRSK